MDGIRNLVERFVAFENRWDACEREVLAHVEASRLDGIREAIAIVGSIGLGCESCIAEALARLSALLPLTSGGEKAECECDGSSWKKIGSYQSACPADTHAPKPAAEKP